MLVVVVFIFSAWGAGMAAVFGFEAERMEQGIAFAVVCAIALVAAAYASAYGKEE